MTKVTALNFYVQPLLLGCACVPTAALAQSQAGGTQQLLSELQNNDEASATHSKDVDLQPRTEAQFLESPDFGEIQIGSIIIADTDGLVRPEFGNVIERFVGTTTGQAGLQDIATAIAAEARSRGYIFASAFVPEQKIALGSLRVTLDLGRIDDVEINGSNNQRLVRMLTQLKSDYGRKDAVERLLLLARDIPGIIIDSTDYVRENGRGKLIIRAREQRGSGWVGIDNYGDDGAGPHRARLEVDYNGIIDIDDHISASVTATPLNPDELTFVSARYANMLGNDGSQLWITGAAGRTHETYPGGDWRSRSRYIALAYNRPILRSSATNLWITAEAAFLDADQSSASGTTLEDHVSTLSLSASGNTKIAGGRLSGGVTFVQGVDLFDATAENDPLSSRPDGSGVFSKGQVWLNWFGLLGSGFSMRIAGNGQIASRPLLASQEIGLGGAGYGRAYSFYERSGDEGAMGLFELRHATDNPAKYVDWIQFYSFVDGGVVSNLENGFGSGGLVSGGGGIRSGFGKAEFGLEVAVPVDDMRSETLNKSPRINLSLGYRF